MVQGSRALPQRVDCSQPDGYSRDLPGFEGGGGCVPGFKPSGSVCQLQPRKMLVQGAHEALDAKKYHFQVQKWFIVGFAFVQSVD